MRAHGERRDRQLLGDLLVAHPVGEQAQDLPLSLGQARQPLRRLRPGQDAGQCGVDVGASAGNDPDRAHQVVERRLLEQEPARARVEPLEQQRLLGVARVEDHRRGRPGSGQAAGDLDPAEARHADVEHGDIGLQLLDVAEGALAVTRLPDELDLVLAFEKAADSVEDRGVVVGHQAAKGGQAAIITPLGSCQMCS